MQPIADACNANAGEFVQYLLGEATQVAERAVSDAQSALAERPQLMALCCMRDSCDLDRIALEICTRWSLFVPVAQSYMYPPSTRRVGVRFPYHSQTNDGLIHILNNVREWFVSHP